MTLPRREAPAQSYKIQVVGHGDEHWFRDQYHRFLRGLSWPAALGVIVALYLAINAAFAAAYLAVGGVEGARRGAFFDAFSFSVQTLGTIGYGAMYPRTRAAQAVVIVESVAELVTALATGLVFAKFSQPTGRIAFARQATVAPVDGVPTLMFRVGNERANAIVEATVRVVIVRTVKTLEGVTFYRMEDVPLRRDRSPAMNRSWTVMHAIDAASPLRGATPESLARDEVEFLVTLVGTDETSFQPVHARRSYEHSAVVWGARHADVLSETAAGDLVLDVRRFHDLEATDAREGFPYRWAGSAAAGLTNGRRSRPIAPETEVYTCFNDCACRRC